jgi:aromatic ring-opening dioxygenase LigB subunit
VTGIVFAAVAPHGGIVIPELCAEGEFELAAATRAAMEELGRRFSTTSPEAVIVLTPHNVHVDGSMAVIVAGRLEGSLEDDAGRAAVRLDVPVDLELALASLVGLVDAGIPTVGVSFGPNDPEQASMPLDWGALIPLWFMGGRAQPPTPVVLVGPARDLDSGNLLAAGKVLATAAAESGKRVAVIASADHGHAHDAEGPYGFDPAAAEYDEIVTGLVRENRLGALAELDPGFVDAAVADSFPQLLVLHGMLGEASDSELLSYEAPTYFGMLCAAFRPRASGGGTRRGARTTT